MDRHQFRHAIARHIGATLTPALCAAIEVEASMPTARYIDVAQFAPLAAGDYVIQAERFADVLTELHPLHLAHWLESEGHRHGLALDPDYDHMARADRAGEMLQFTVRHQGALVGNLRMFVGRSIHSRNKTAWEDTLFIAPAHRTGMLGLKLLRYAEACLTQIGVREISADSKSLNNADVLMRRMGFKQISVGFHKLLPPQDEAA